MKKRNFKMLLPLVIIFSMFLTTHACAESSAKTLEILDEAQHLFEGYIDIDNGYDYMNSVREKFVVEATNAIVSLQMESSAAVRAHLLATQSEIAKTEIDLLARGQKKMEEKEITPRLKKMRKIVDEMMDLTYDEYENSKESLNWALVRADPSLKEVTGMTGSDKEGEKIIKKANKFEEKSQKLEGKLAAEQKKLIEYHRQLIEKVKESIRV